jgi:hypothetical protein
MLQTGERFATVICNACCFDTPAASETETEKLKLPLAEGVPENAPVLSAICTPCGSWPEVTEKE